MSQIQTNLAEALLSEITNPEVDANFQDLGSRDIELIRSYLDRDLYAFAIYICGFRDLIPTLHRDLAQWIALWGMVEVEGVGWQFYSQVSSDARVTRDYRRIMTQIPREHFKTSLGTLANALWQVSHRDPDGAPGIYRPIAIFNERQDNATKWLRAIRDIIQSSLAYQTIYAELVPPGVVKNDPRPLPRWWKWNDSEIDLAGKRTGEVEASISAHGIESATVGGHWPKIILDDLVSLKHKQSVVEMERARQWIKNHTYLMRPAEGSLGYVNCTPWTYTDVYVDLCRDFGYKLYRRSALEDTTGKPDITNGLPIFPQKLSREKLLDMHKRDPFGFNSQMMCIPLSGEHQSFKVEWLKFGKIVSAQNGEPVFVIDEAHYTATRSEAETVRGESATPPPRQVPLYLLDKCIIVDPAPTETAEQKRDPHARTGILVVGLDAWGRKFILEAWAGNAGYEAVIDKIFELSIKWSTTKLAVEEVNFSNVYRHWVSREQRHDGKYPGHYLQTYPLLPKGREKHARILAKEPEWRQGLWYLNEIDTFAFQVEFVEYPNSQTIDLMDCMGYEKECLSRPETEEETRVRMRMERQGAPYSTSYQPTLQGY